ncbi:hypothetical protein V1517DRAFT_337062 [Lipomyces orientalis]|uniref:Uncharacterized protein n=1 Tax=Lipomyces orientalis TaxID=1233043 RepID=A0ACC3TUA7_9ASCO
MPPASSTNGFFQDTPRLQNQFLSDYSLQRVLKHYAPKAVFRSVAKDLRRFGDYVISKEIFSWVADAEKNLPTVDQFDAFGNIKNQLNTSEGWRMMKNISATEGLIAEAYERKYREYSRVVQFAKYYLFAPSSAVFSCPLAMTDGCARVIELYSPTKTVYGHLISRDPKQFWTSGQWMTERTGGSDVSGTETFATKTSNDPSTYTIKGFKWFASATDSEVTLLLAREKEAENLSCYLGYVKDGGTRIVRLKNKLGTKALPTAELELNGLAAELLGPRQQGVSVIATVLIITRIHNSVNAVSFLRRALEIAKAFSIVRKVSGKPLFQVQAHVRTLADVEIQHRAMTHLTFYCVFLLGKVECNVAGKEEVFMLRMLTSIVKAITAKVSLAGISECMEGLGGVGYLENEPELNIARLARDAQVLSIWEGTTNVLSDDFIRAVKNHTESLPVISQYFADTLDGIKSADVLSMLSEEIRTAYAQWRDYVANTDLNTLRANARKTGLFLAKLIACTLLVVDAATDNDAVAIEIARRYVAKVKDRDSFSGLKECEVSESKIAELDTLIVYGFPIASEVKARL